MQEGERMERKEKASILKNWQEGLVAGNGKSGIICSCNPYNEVITYQNIDLLMPTEEPRTIPKEVGEELEEARQAVLHMDDSWNVHGRKRTYLYAYHPGMQLAVNSTEQTVLTYTRQMCGETGEIRVDFEDTTGTWSRSSFVSEEDDCVITQFLGDGQKELQELVLSITAPEQLPRFGVRKCGIGPEVNMKYELLYDADATYLGQAAHYPAYPGSELADRGYVTLVRIFALGGEKRLEKAEGGNQIHIRRARAVWMIAKTAAQVKLGAISEFPGKEMQHVIGDVLKEIDEAVAKYQTCDGGFHYEKALDGQKQFWKETYGTVKFALGDTKGTHMENPVVEKDNETLLQHQKEVPEILPELAERVYRTGRYVQAACAGYSAPRLCGLWTGEWNPGWSGAYTMDANVNIQVSGMNTGHMEAAARGYIYFILRQIDDWTANAAAVYGMWDALLAPVNTDGNRAVMVEYDIDYPFQYWNAGAGWLTVPIFEYWQCFGNRRIPLPEDLKKRYGREAMDLEQEILRPLLGKTLHFWEQLCTPEYYTDVEGNPHYKKGKTILEEGEHYLIIPSYSPENHPVGYTSAITANAAMDIATARDVLRMTRELGCCIADRKSEEQIAACDRLESGLPDYQTDETGGLKEWSLPQMKDNHEHRHISHLYCAWPGVETQHNEKLAESCRQAIRNRNIGNAGKDDTASHGWIHKGLVAARLKDGKSLEEILRLLFHSDIFYSSLLTDHNTDRSRKVYCTDTILGLQGIINEALVYSERGLIEFLPALPEKWKKGCVEGLMARTRVCIRKLSWDMENRTLEAMLESGEDQEIWVSCPMLQRKEKYILKKGEQYRIRF